MQTRRFVLLALILSSWIPPTFTGRTATYDLVIRNGTIYDGSGTAPFRGDVAVDGDRIAAVGALSDARGRAEVDATGLAVAPGFINMLSWANESLIEDGRSQGDLRQGVTLEVMGEGESMGPLSNAMKREMVERQGDIKFEVKWTTLAEYLDYLVQRGISCNVASFVGATTVRIHEVGYADRPPTPAELERMKGLVRQAMEDGALGVGSSLIYAPAFYAKTDELIALAKVASESRGKSPEETAMDLVVEDGSRVSTVYFLMSEENVRKQLALPWVSFGSDAESFAPEGVFLKSNPHPRAYGNFARWLGRYVRDEKLVRLEEAIRRLTSLPAENLKLERRGALKAGCFADVVVFDPATIADHATYDKPHQYSTGVRDVWVNGVPVLKNGEHTGAKPGRAVLGPGWRKGR